jgi:hypothetical protein
MGAAEEMEQLDDLQLTSQTGQAINFTPTQIKDMPSAHAIVIWKGYDVSYSPPLYPLRSPCNTSYNFLRISTVTISFPSPAPFLFSVILSFNQLSSRPVEADWQRMIPFAVSE